MATSPLCFLFYKPFYEYYSLSFPLVERIIIVDVIGECKYNVWSVHIQLHSLEIFWLSFMIILLIWYCNTVSKSYSGWNTLGLCDIWWNIACTNFNPLALYYNILHTGVVFQATHLPRPNDPTPNGVIVHANPRHVNVNMTPCIPLTQLNKEGGTWCSAIQC